MSSSDDDKPLRMSNGHGKLKSEDKISKSVDKAMDHAVSTAKVASVGISIRNGPMEDGMDLDGDGTNGHVIGKRKQRASLTNGKSYKDASDSDDDDEPLSKKRRTASTKLPAEDSDSDNVPLVRKKPPPASKTAIGQSDSAVPLESTLSKQKQTLEVRAEQQAKALRREEKQVTSMSSKKKKVKENSSDDEDDVKPQSKKRSTSSSTKITPQKKGKSVKKEDSDHDTPVSKRKSNGKAVGSAHSTKKDSKGKKEVKTEEDEDADKEEEEYHWWEAEAQGDGSKKWDTLEHNGVVFPPDYEPLPKNVRMLYDGKPVDLQPEAEEIAFFFGSMLNSTHNVENPVFQKNFFSDFRDKIKASGGAHDRDGNKVAIKEFAKCDFKSIFEFVDAERMAKKALSGPERKALKAAKDEAEAPYMYCTWDGRKQKVGNFRVEPPSLFRGRGEHPKTGMVKNRVLPEQVTINIGKGAKVPDPPKGHKWKEIKHDQAGTWLAMWNENINGAYKYVMLAANSDVKGQSDYKKFEKARNLKKYIDIIRKDYNKDMKAEKMADRQRATAMYLIDKFALRAGNEKGEDEADTVGCCSLKFEHVELKPPNTVIFDFLGKDSIRFYDEVTVETQVFKNLRIFKKSPKTKGDDIFDRLTTSSLNKHLNSYMEGLTAKVFRTYNASFTFSELLKALKPHGTPQEKVKDYNDANRRVAILCNHKRTVTASHEQQMAKMGDRVKGLKYQKWRLKQMMIDVDPKCKAKLKKKYGDDYFELDDEITQEWVEEHQAHLVAEHRTKVEKKFQKENEKLAAEGEKEMKTKELDDRLKECKEMEKMYTKENKTKKVEAEGRSPTIEKLEANVEKVDQRVANMTLQAQDKEDNKEVALGTSKINYIDPRLTVVFCKKFNVPIEKFFSKTLREKFDWAVKSVDEDWQF